MFDDTNSQNCPILLNLLSSNKTSDHVSNQKVDIRNDIKKESNDEMDVDDLPDVLFCSNVNKRCNDPTKYYQDILNEVKKVEPAQNVICKKDKHNFYQRLYDEEASKRLTELVQQNWPYLMNLNQSSYKGLIEIDNTMQRIYALDFNNCGSELKTFFGSRNKVPENNLTVSTGQSEKFQILTFAIEIMSIALHSSPIFNVVIENVINSIMKAAPNNIWNPKYLYMTKVLDLMIGYSPEYDDFYVLSENRKVSFNKMLKIFSNHIGDTKGMHFFLKFVSLSEQLCNLDKHKQLTIIMLFRMQGFWSGIEDYKNSCSSFPVFKVVEIYVDTLIVKYNIRKLIADITQLCAETFERGFFTMSNIFGTKCYNSDVTNYFPQY